MDEAPKQNVVKPSVCLASIVHALFVCKHPIMSHEQSWDGTNYNVQNSEGSRGTISFSGNQFVGAAYSPAAIERTLEGVSALSNDNHLIGAPDDIRDLAYSEAWQYLLQNTNGRNEPVITAAFWGDGVKERIQHVGSWKKVVDNGVFLFRRQMLRVPDAMREWAQECDLSHRETDLIMTIFKRKENDWTKLIRLNPSEKSFLLGLANGDDEGWEECELMLRSIGVDI